MNPKHTMSLMLAGVLTLGVGDVAGQDEENRRGPLGGIDVESVMSMRERLGLDESQLEELEAWRTERLARLNERRARMEDMRSRVRAGQIDRSEMRALLEGRREELRSTRDDARARLEGILDAGQLETLDGVIRERRAFARGRASAGRGGRPGMRGGRGGARPGRGTMGGGRRGLRDSGPGMRPRGPGMRGRPGMLRGNPGPWRNPGGELR